MTPLSSAQILAQIATNGTGGITGQEVQNALFGCARFEAYVSGTTYYWGQDVLTSDNAIYRCIVTSTGTTPPGPHWIALATAPVAAVPETPFDVSATAGDTTVDVEWAVATGAATYSVKRSTTSGGTYATVAAGITAYAFTDTGLSDGTTYYYVVTASNAIGESSASAEVSATPAASGGGGFAGFPSTWHNQGDATANVSSGTLTMTDSAHSGTNRLCGLEQVLSTGSSWSYCVVLHDGATTPGSHQQVYLYLRDSSSGKWTTCGYDYDLGSKALQFSDDATFVGSRGSGGSSDVTVAAYFRISLAGGTVTYDTSTDGSTWTTLATESLTAYGTWDRVGVGINSADTNPAVGVFTGFTGP